MADLSLFREVEAGLEKNSVGWENSVSSLLLAYRHFESEETQAFLRKCLNTIVSILLDQHPGRIEPHQRQCIEKSLHYSVGLLLKLLEADEENFVYTVILLFNKKKVFYRGGTINYWNTMPGAPEVRNKCISSFAEDHGFEAILRLLRTKLKVWIGADNAKILLQAVLEGRAIRDDSLPQHLCTCIMEPLAKLSEEELKKESTEAMSQLIQLIRRIMEVEDNEGCFQFWLSLTLTYIRSSSLPLRLFAWDQMVDLIDAARKARPPARRFLVKGAGVDYVNGYYEHTRDRNGAPEYARDCGNGIVLTLFRCQMRSRAKWWFLSEADKDQPGTDKDIDYYQHRSNALEDQEPSPSGWITCSSASAKGKDPPPKLERLEPLCEPGQEEATLEHKLKAWVLSHHVVEEIFGSSMHREVVNRSASVLKFLAGMKALGAEQLDMMWKSCLGKAEAELVEEIHTVLAGLITSLTPELVVHLLEGVRTSIREDGALPEAVALSEKLAQLNLHELSQLGQNVLDSLLLLLWELLQQPAIRQHKAYDAINEVLAQALKQVSEATRQYAFLEQSLDMVRRSAAERSAADFDELAVINALQMTQFLLEVFNSSDIALVIEQVAERQKLPVLLFQELASFKHRCNLRAQAGRPDPAAVMEERIKLRLDVLRYVHAFSEKVQLSFLQVVAIWEVLDTPAEKELCMVFLSDACKVKGNMQMAFSFDVILEIFRDLICQRADWTLLGERAYSCFNYYYSGLRKKDTQEIKTVGLDALWRIALTARTQTVAEAATRDLLTVYGEGEGDSDGGGSRLQFLKRIFEHLAACRDERRTATGHGNGVETSLKAERCLKLLQGAVGNGKQSITGPGQPPLPHGVRGEAGRKCIFIEPRKIVPAGLGQARQQTAQKLDVFVLMMHPLETIGVMRRRVAARCDHPLAQIRLMCTGKQLQKDEVSIGSCGLAEGAELQAILMPHKVGTQTFGPAAADDFTAMAVSTASPSGATAPVGEIISREDSYCNILFELLESGMDASVSAAIWELLLAIPTQVHALEHVKLTAMGGIPTASANNDGSGDSVTSVVPEWSALISPIKWDRSVYYLQIVDFLLQPSEDMSRRLDLATMPAREFLRALIRTGGFSHILEVFMRTGGDSTIQNMATAVALRIVKFCLFGQQESPRSNNHHHDDNNIVAMMPVDGEDGVVRGEEQPEVDPTRLLGGSKRLRPLLDRLVTVAAQTHEASAAEGSWQVTVDALATIELLMQQSDMVTSLVENPVVKGLFISIILRNPHPKVRQQLGQVVLAKQAEELAPPFFQWSLEALEALEPECTTCQQFFDVLQQLVKEPAKLSTRATALLTSLAKIVTDKLSSFPRVKESTEKRHQVLRGYLHLLRELVVQDREAKLFKGTKLEDLITCALSDMLFAVPSMELKDSRPICSHTDTESRQLVFLTLQALVKQRQEDLHLLLVQLFSFTDKGTKGLRHRWGYECSFDAKATPTQYVGLRNQGCTCYMNSLLQQLFMVPQLRDAIMAARVKRRRTISASEFSDQDLVGQRIILHWESGMKVEAQVREYDRRTNKHVIKYDGSDEVLLSLREGRAEKETGEVDVIPPPKRCSVQVVQEKEMTQKVLEQVQRTFCYLQWSEKRFFDPRPLVEACKCLNLNYSVYQQNDASEFCDKLLDKLEAALKGGPQAKELQMCFGGKFAYQKIPQDCEHRTENEEPFIKVELIIRGKDSIQESLAAFVEGEMMDGENKVECEKCNTKKPTFRRTCLSQLPNLLILHLKRFDLDFSTFETVKLNNRCAFPMRLNVKPYTREGLEEAARAKATEEAAAAEEEQQGGEGGGPAGGQPQQQQAEEGAGVAVPMVLDDGDYEYELKGVVIHAGVAQGGHYYSFIKDRNSEAEDCWYRFDDEDVQAFDPSQIEQYCFGGTTIKTNTWNGVTSTIEQERVANALMLFYEKVRPRAPTEEGAQEQPATPTMAGTPAAAAEPVGAEGGATTSVPMVAAAEAPEAEVVKMEVGGAPAVAGAPEGGSGGGEGDGVESGDKSNANSGTTNGAGSDEDAEDFEYAADGRSAFEEEVWQANVGFIYHSYLFDQQFHAFLSGLLAMAFPRGGGARPAGGGTPTVAGPEDDEQQVVADPASNNNSGMDQGFAVAARPAAPPAIHVFPASSSPALTTLGSGNLSLGFGVDPALANPGAPLWDPRADGNARMRMDVFRLGVLFLLDVILHSRERPGIQAWVGHLKQAMRVDPNAASYLVQSLSTSGVSWLRNYFLECSDSTARGWVLQLVVTAILELASRDDEREALALPVPEALEKSQVAVLLNAAMNLLLEANKHWRHTDELFLLFRDVAKQSEAIRDFLVRADLVCRLGVFVLGERAPPALRTPPYCPMQWGGGCANSSSSSSHEVSHHGHDLLYLLEAIVTLVGVPQIQKVPLLEEPSMDHASAQDYRLTPAARHALCQIFAQYQRQGSMGMPEIVKYLDACNSAQPQPVSQFQIKSMLQKYDTTADNRLTQNGFLTYYRDTAVYSAKSVWQDLHMHGFRNDLSQGRMPAEYDLVELSGLPRLCLPQHSQLALAMACFYVPMFDVLWNETTGILVRVCTENWETSDRIIQQTTLDLHNFISHYGMSHHQHMHGSIDVHIHMLSVLLNITDSFAEERHDQIFWGDPYGVARALLMKSMRQPPQNQDFNLRHQVQHYMMGLNDLFRKHPASRNHMEQRRPKEWQMILHAHRSNYEQGGFSHSHHQSMYDSPSKRGGDSEDESDEYDDCPIVRVEGAGLDAINGIYRRVRMWDDVGVYEQQHEDRGAGRPYTLYRCRLESGDHRWYISILPRNRNPGTTDDQDFYYAHSIHPEAESLPPDTDWKSCTPAYEPAPRIYLETETGGGLDDDSDEADVGSEPHSHSGSPPNLDGSDNELMTPNESPSHPGHGF